MTSHPAPGRPLGGYGVWQPFDELSAEEIDRHLLLNVRASLLLAKEFAARFEPRADGPAGGRMPFSRWGTPEDAARVIGWLACDDAAWITGQVINSEGGFR